MPAAERVMQRNVPTVLSFSTHSNLSVGNILISPVALSRDTVRIALPPPAQQTSTRRSEEHTSELQSLMRISYAVFCLKKKKHKPNKTPQQTATRTYKQNTKIVNTHKPH